MTETTTAPLSPADERALACLLDEVIPPSADGRMPGAGALGLARALHESLARAPEVRALVASALAALDEGARAAGEGGFAAASPTRRRALVLERETAQPGLMPTLAFCLYPLYYRHPRVLEGLGLEGRPPFPKGYEVEPFDEGLLAPVRALPPLFRTR